MKHSVDIFSQEKIYTSTPPLQIAAISPLDAISQPTMVSSATQETIAPLPKAVARLNSRPISNSFVAITTHTQQLAATAQPTVTPEPEAALTATPTATSVVITEMPLRTSTPSFGFGNLPIPELEVFIYAPEIPMAQPVVILTAIGTATRHNGVEIRGKINQVEFICPGMRCELPVIEDSVITFRAYSSSGAASPQVMATIRVNKLNGNYIVTIGALMPPVLFVDACADFWGTSSPAYLEWAKFPQSPTQLNTKRILHYLVSQLLILGLVDASDCPGDGLIDNIPNACGLERAKSAMVAWQNQFDLEIWLSGKDNGIPPILLKQLIEFESQFWPESTRFFLYEYGLAQINQLGTDVAMRWDRDLYIDVCRSVLADCHISYYLQSESSRSMIRGALTSMLDADCQQCLYGLDMDKAHQSVWLISRIMRANCLDTKFLLGEYGYTASYDDYWKFTLVSYHSGSWCLQDAIRYVAQPGSRIYWGEVAPRLSCPGAREYVDQFWASLSTFKDGLVQPGEFDVGQVIPTFLPTPTPTPLPTYTPSPTPVLSDAKIRVQVFIDLNANGLPDELEWLDEIPVRLNLENGVQFFGTTVAGEVVFDMTGNSAGLRGIVSLPGLYRSSEIVLPEHGEMFVVFMFTKPLLPTDLP
ncbi:MAG: hypothetical protein JXA78_16245 [Anaerolineales bacterium]|nr:hypothetical protein [Anaerolineales bacterium]